MKTDGPKPHAVRKINKAVKQSLSDLEAWVRRHDARCAKPAGHADACQPKADAD